VIRTFIALEVPAIVKTAIADCQRELRRIRKASVSWTRPEGIHLTLKFLGEIEERRLPDIIKAVEVASDGRSSVKLATTRPGGFPRLAHPKVLWLGIEPSTMLMSLQADIDMRLAGKDFPPEERAYHPHLTVGRVKSLDQDCELPARFGSVVFERVEWTAGEVLVMSSQLKPSGAEYRVEGRIALHRQISDG